MSTPPASRDSGMALLVVLWTLLLVGVVAASLSSEARKEGLLARNGVALARAEAAAEGGVIQAVAAMADPRPEARWAADGSVHRFMLDGIGIEVRIVDEAGKVDLNAGAPELLAALLEVAGAPPGTAFGIASEVAALRAGTATGQPRGLETTAELMGVPGMTPALFERVAPFVTVLTRARGVDPAVAPRAVLMALTARDPTVSAAQLVSAGAAPPGLPSGDFVMESQHSVYAIDAVATAGSASYVRQAIVRLTHNAETPFLVHAWSRLPGTPRRR